ncbi:hypothetical protein [Streptomyces sp. NPDC005407]|uniref:hypothetical protein n=1 Tax=Streptomyces sp. NPDC005407 TaxID=3155340 RepID=UPI0033AA2151
MRPPSTRTAPIRSAAWSRPTGTGSAPSSELLTRLGHADAESAAGALLMLYDGAMAAGYLDDSTAAQKTLLNAVRLIRSGG